MASIKKYSLRDGTERFRVVWVEGGRDGEAQSVSFDNETDAEVFKKAVNKNQNRWPPNYVRNLGWVDPQMLAEEKARLDAEAQAAAEAARKVLFRDYVAAWLDAAEVEPGTCASYRYQVDKHILPSLGDLELTDPAVFNRDAMVAWVRRMFAGTNPGRPGQAPPEPLKYKTVSNITGLMSQIVQSAVDADPPLRSSNPAAKIKLAAVLAAVRAEQRKPGPDAPQDWDGDEADDDEDDDADEGVEMVFLTHEEYGLLFPRLDADVRVMVEVLAGTGMRYGEVTALQARDLFLDGPHPYLMVRRAWKRSATARFRLGTPKSKASIRRISLSPYLVTLLREAAAGRRPKDLVFCRPGGGRWRGDAFRMWRWAPALYMASRCEACRREDGATSKRAIRRLGRFEPCGHPGTLMKLPRVHDLRHTHCAWMIGARMPLPLIMKRLGHASITTTIDTYGHLVPELDEEWLAYLDAVLTTSAALPEANHLVPERQEVLSLPAQRGRAQGPARA